MLKQGEIAYVKTTNEPVFVIAVQPLTPADDAWGYFTHHVYCRIPVITQNGTDYQQKVFYVEELETLEDFTRRQIANFQRGQQMTQDALQKEGTAAPKGPKTLLQ